MEGPYLLFFRGLSGCTSRLATPLMRRSNEVLLAYVLLNHLFFGTLNRRLALTDSSRLKMPDQKGFLEPAPGLNFR